MASYSYFTTGATMIDDNKRETIEDITHRLRFWQIAGCSCETKTPEVKYHVPYCRYRLLEEGAVEIESLRAGMEQIRRIPEVLPISREIELLAILKRFMDFQVSDYDRVADRAKDYCAIRRDARKLLQRYGVMQRHFVPDSDGHCSRCGLEFEDPAILTHECPPGFTATSASQQEPK